MKSLVGWKKAGKKKRNAKMREAKEKAPNGLAAGFGAGDQQHLDESQSMTTIAINAPSVKEGLTISLGFREFRNGCVRFTPTSVFSPSEFNMEALIEKIRRALGGAITLAAEAIFQPKVKDAKPFIVVSRDGKKELELELQAPDSMLDRLEECVTVLLAKFAGVVFVSRSTEGA